MAMLAESSVIAMCAGFTVLLVDSDLISLSIISKMLRKFSYEVRIAVKATDALCIIQDRGYEIDLVLANSCLPDMGKYELLETMRTMSKLPVIIVLSDSNPIAVRGCLFKGAVSCLFKPITINDVKSLWKFVINNVLAAEETSGIEEESLLENALGVDLESRLLISEGRQNLKNDEEENDDSKVFGIDGAHPKKILQHMNVPGLNTKNILNHLQEQDAIQKTMYRGSTAVHVASQQQTQCIKQLDSAYPDWTAEWVTSGRQVFHQIGNSEQFLKGVTDLLNIGDSGLESSLHSPMHFDDSLLEKQQFLLPEPLQLPPPPQNQEKQDNFGAEAGRVSDELFTIGKVISELFYHDDFDGSSSDQFHV